MTAMQNEQRYFIYLAYNGRPFVGWQRQPNGYTVQQCLEEALGTLLREPVPIVGAGRTDTGVHARQMVAHFDWHMPLADPHQLVYKLNKLLPREVAIDRIVAVRPEAHARFSALSRTYHYYITHRKEVFRFDQLYLHPGALDFDAMNDACRLLFDYTDFTSFSKLHTDTKTNNCRIDEACWRQEEEAVWRFTIRADRFLRNMVRAIVGTLIEVGRGKLTLADFRRVIEAKDRGQAGTSAPAHALFLAEVAYPETLFYQEEVPCG